MDTLVFIERPKHAQVIEELVRALYQGVLSIQDSLEGTDITCHMLDDYVYKKETARQRDE